jgi:hypothetical protein
MAIFATVAIALGTAAIAAGLHHLVQRRFGYDILARHNDVAGFIYSAIGVIFAVVLGFVVVVVWEKYDQVRNYVDAEVAAAIDLYHVVDGFPEPQRDRIRAQLRAYGTVVVQREWATMARGQLAQGGIPEIEAVAHEVQTFRPVGPSQQDAQQLALVELRDLFDARRQRVRASEPSVPPLLWFALFAGAAATLGFTYLFGVKNRIAQLLMTGSLAALVAIMFVVIQALDSPFSGPSPIQPTPWVYFATHLDTIDHPPSSP